MNSTKQSIFFHNRSVVDAKFHPDGDVLFSASKDSLATMINLDGKLLHVFRGHEGALSTLTANENTLTTCGLDLFIMCWDVITGKEAAKLDINSVIRGIDRQDHDIYFSTDHSIQKSCFIGHYDTRTETTERIYHPEFSTTKMFVYKNFILFSDTEGNVSQLDIRSNSLTSTVKLHKARIASIKGSSCRSFFISASADNTTAIVDTASLEVKRRFEYTEPVNAACIKNTNDIAVLAGGIDARDVTTTKGKGSFSTTFYDIVSSRKVGSYTTHFGTINCVDIHPAGSHYCSGGEDGSVAIVRFGSDFYNAPFTAFS